MTPTVGLVLAVLMLIPPTIGMAQEEPPRVGLLRSGQAPDPFADAFQDEMRQLGYVEGETIVYDVRWAEGDPERLPELARELAAQDVDVILTGGDNAIRAARDAAPGVPIVMGASNDPVGTGLAQSLARPGGTVTGLTIASEELSKKRLEVFKDAVPGLARVAALYNPAFPSARVDLQSTEAAARSLGLDIETIPVTHASEFDDVFAEMERGEIHGLITLADPFFTAHRGRLVDLARSIGLPTMFYWREFVQDGGLLSYGPDNAVLYRRAAHFVDRILRGAKPDELPIERPTSFVLAVNLQTAAALGIKIPASILLRADEVIE
jgi:putative ABC transport system substrate-binding protein